VSFRRRLTLFFVLIVVLPMVALAALVLQVAGSSRTGKADARLSAGLETALSVYRDELAEAEDAAREAARDPALAAAIRAGDRRRTEAALARLVRGGSLAGARVLAPNGRPLAEAGSGDTVADAELTLERAGRVEGTLVASTTSATAYVDRVRDLTGRSAVVSDEGGRVLATTVPVGDLALPEPGTARTVEMVGDELRAASARLGAGGPEDVELRLTLLGRLDSAGFAATRPLIAAALAAFFLIALAFVAMLMRSLQGQVGGMLAAARRIGSGDFSRKLPVEGNDEMAGLASEFNQMSDRLSAQMGELRRQRTEIEQSVRRIGEAFASGLDRSALLEIVAETALSAAEAEHARIVLSPDRDPEAQAGPQLAGPMRDAVLEAERRALTTHATAEAEIGDAYALAHPLGAHEGSGVMSIARRGRAFDEGQRDVLRYLIGQAAVSIENVELHEVVAEQAVTDELTGLPNNRRFRRWISDEAARAERFGHELSLLMLDIDDFKQVNDTYGHLQGDEVLRAVGRVLREESRGVDEPARYGGEEFAIGLPETGIEGAVDFAERVRERIARTEVPRVEGGDGAIRVTASVGAATGEGAAVDPRTLIDAADQALYRAKRGGKNRTERGELAAANGGARRGAGKPGSSAKIRSDG
jgi:diguanylate cyclase (GGDEF)-like protein